MEVKKISGIKLNDSLWGKVIFAGFNGKWQKRRHVFVPVWTDKIILGGVSAVEQWVIEDQLKMREEEEEEEEEPRGACVETAAAAVP